MGIQIGDRIQSQDQSITFVNFNVMNTMVRRPKKPIPVLLLDWLFAITLLLLGFFFQVLLLTFFNVVVNPIHVSFYVDVHLPSQMPWFWIMEHLFTVRALVSSGVGIVVRRQFDATLVTNIPAVHLVHEVK